MTSSPPPLGLGRKLPGWLIGSGVIAVAMGVMNVTTYLFTILAARLLGPAHYSELAAMMGLLMVATVLSLGLQATGARRVSAAPEMTPVIEQDILAVSYRAALALGVVSLVASPIISVVLHLNSPLTAAMLAITVIPVTVMGGQAGVLQGERRWTPLALIYLMTGVGRLACGLVGLLWSADALGAMVGVAVGAFFPTVVGWFALRHPTRVAENARSATEHVTTVAAGLIREVLHNSHALLAFFALSNADVVVARTTLSEHQAGLYAGGLILTKAVLFMPQFVVVIAFPSMASGVARRSTHIKSLGLVLGIGAVAVLGTAALSSLAVTFIGGPEYATLQGQLWAFAVLGTLLALIQIMVYDVVARQHKRAVYVIWAALLALLAAIPFVATHTALLAVVTSVDVTLLVILLLVSLLRPVQTPPEPAERDTTIQPQ